MDELVQSVSQAGEASRPMFKRPIIIGLMLLLAFDIGFTFYAAWRVQGGVNRDLGFLAGGLSQVLLVSAMLAIHFHRNRLFVVLILGAFAGIAWHFTILAQ